VKTLFRINPKWDSYLPLAVLAVAAFLRLFNLAYPGTLVFDETYYVKDAYSLLHHGVELSWGDKSDAAFITGDTSGLSNDPSFIVHPPLGKWLIGLGMLVFGSANPFGWRIVVALLGVAAVWLTMKCAEMLFKSKRWAAIAGLLFAIDGVGIVLSRTALLDQILGFFVILGYYFLLKYLEAKPTKSFYRPWLLLSAIALGCATATKWSGLYFVAAFIAYVALVDTNKNYQLHKKLEVESEGKLPDRLWLVPSIYSAIKTFFLITIPTLLIYVLSWTGWFLSSNGYDRNWADTHKTSGLLSYLPKSLQSFWQYHKEIYGFHTNLHESHPYGANPLSWIFMLRPTSFFWDQKNSGCLLETKGTLCTSAITALGNPFIWWAAILAASVLIGSWFRTRDKKTVLIFLGIVAGYVPWLFLMGRTVFEFYVIAFEPWVIFILIAGLKAWKDHSYKPLLARRLIFSFIWLCVLGSVFFYPIWTGLWEGYDFWRLHMWLPSWI
jgi:dolichyl-phosphate-mannose--protein O-mannosyl transferase